MFDFQKATVGKGSGKIRIPYRKKEADLGDILILSAVNLPSGSSAAAMAMKKAPTSKEKEFFMNRVVNLLVSNLRQLGWTSGFYIVTPQSSSRFAEELAKMIQAKVSGVTFIPRAFRKGKGTEIQVREDKKGFSDAIRASVYATVNRLEKTNTVVEAKKVYKKHLKFMSGLMIYSAPKNLNGTKVMIVDDVVTSGATIASMNEELLAMGVTKTIAVTALKIDGRP